MSLIQNLCLFLKLSGLIVAASNNGSNFFEYKTNSVKGVALGGWLVLEPYITPSLFYEAGNMTGETPVDEYHFAEILQDENRTDILRIHWDTFINESDFQNIKSWGLNMVRIPIGYWAFEKLDDDPYISGQEEYLDKAIGWAEDNGLKVWIDLHGVPGSQNGFDNSGLRDQIDWQKNDTNLDVTSDVLDYIFNKYANNTKTISGFEIVNEPMGPKLSMYELKHFYLQSYKSLRNYTINNMVMHDAFQSIGYWNKFLIGNSSNTTYKNVVVDHHHYEVFGTGQLNSSIDQHIQNVVNYGDSITDEKHPAVVGEWSAALTDCVFWLNGVGRGARFDGTYENDNAIGSCENIQNFDHWSEQYKNDTRRFIELQLYGYSLTEGWIFWTYKTENTIDWDLQKLIENDLFPQPLDNYSYNVTEYIQTHSSSSSGIDISSGSFLEPSWWIYIATFALVILI